MFPLPTVTETAYWPLTMMGVDEIGDQEITGVKLGAPSRTNPATFVRQLIIKAPPVWVKLTGEGEYTVKS